MKLLRARIIAFAHSDEASWQQRLRQARTVAQPTLTRCTNLKFSFIRATTKHRSLIVFLFFLKYSSQRFFLPSKLTPSQLNFHSILPRTG